jgi:transcription initiation factor TFIIIB Brf1 subunit/transcription initiation factor TFIIB
LSYSDDILNSDNNFLVIAQNIRNDVSICKIVDKIITDPESGEIVCSNCGMVITDKVEDALKKARDVKDIGHYSSGNTEITIKDRNEISYSLSIIKQAYEKS